MGRSLLFLPLMNDISSALNSSLFFTDCIKELGYVSGLEIISDAWVVLDQVDKRGPLLRESRSHLISYSTGNLIIAHDQRPLAADAVSKVKDRGTTMEPARCDGLKFQKWII